MYYTEHWKMDPSALKELLQLSYKVFHFTSS